MRRSLLSTWLIALLGLAVVGAQPCGVAGPAARSFAAGALVIPMDNCYQRRDSGSTPAQGVACNATADDGVFRAYGLVYFLLKHGVTVYWAIDPAKPRATPSGADGLATGLDVTVPAPASGVVAQRMSWTNGSFADLATGTSGISYLGGPFIVDAADADRVVAMLTQAGDPAHADFARFQAEATATTPNVIDIHRVQSAFDAPQVRPLTGPPPKLAILNVTPPAGGKTSSNVMYQYAVAAGLSWPCTGNGDCAGGLGPSCSKSGVLAYLANPAGDTAIPQQCSGTPQVCAPNFNQGPGLIYDVLCDDDFVPPGAGKTYADTQLAAGNYKLLWIPHWDTHGTTPTGATDPAAAVPLPPGGAADRLAWQLRSIASFVDAGNNLFVECLGIQALEGIAAEDNVNGKPIGIPATRFQSPAGILRWNGSGALQPLLVPSHPNVQIGDFTYSVVSGAITTYYPDGAKAPADAYLGGTQRLVTETPSSTPPPSWDVSSTIQVVGRDGAPRGNVAYLGGHDYSPRVGNAPGSTGQTAGTRIVLNTLFNLGFGCADPDPADPASQCNTGQLGVCARGHLRCASGGGLQCVPDSGPSPEICDGLDNDCNGLVDEGDVCNPPTCTPGATRSCYDGATGTAGKGACLAGTQTCNGGAWGPCLGQVLPSPEVCNGKDDDCSGLVDDGNLCGSGATCSGGVCVPSSCNGETVRCPIGFACVASGATRVCQPVGCPSAPCGTGLVCQSGQCVDPCAGVSCGKGSACSGGQCVAGGCALTGCAAGQACVSGSCVADPCAGVACATGTFCRLGDCVRSCSFVDCAPGQACDVDGFCVPTCSPACAAGESCDAGTCRPDPCAGISCGASQECRGGACVDAACSHVVCPQGQACSAGQCLGASFRPLQGGGSGTGNTALVAAPPAPPAGGCGSGPGGLTSLAALLAAVLWRRARPAPVPARVAAPTPRSRRARRAAGWPGTAALLVAVAALATGCGGGKGAGTPGGSDGGTDGGSDGGVTATCSGSQTDLSRDLQNCGACGHACASGYGCVAGGCLFPTGNPYLASIDPATAGIGSQLALRVAGEGFQAGATLRVSGDGFTREAPLTVESVTAGRVAGLDLSGLAAGTAEVRVVNPGRLVSNVRALALVDQLLLRGVTPAGVRQDQAGTVDLVLIGSGFVQGAQAQLAAGGTSQALPTTWVSAGEVRVLGLAPGTLAVGQYDLTVTNPGGAPSTSLKFTVMEGAPTLASVTPTCMFVNQRYTGTVTGTNLYPTSVVRVSGGSIQDSPLPTACPGGADALGRCAGGALVVTVDLTGVPASQYDVTVVNPGSPAPLRSARQTIQVTSQGTPANPVCP